MKATLIKAPDGYHLYDGLKAIATTIIDNAMLLPNLSKKNCDEIFSTMDAQALADKHYDETVDYGLESKMGFIKGFKKAMELYNIKEPKEIQVEVFLDKVDDDGFLILKKL